MYPELPRSKPRFSGSFHTWRVTISTDREKGTVENFLVFSSGKREAVSNYLWLKFLWNELTRTEFNLFLILLNETYDEKKWSFLRLLTYKSRKELRRNLIKIEEILGEVTSNRERYLGYKGIRIEIHRETRRLARVPKFSGYVRNISSLGRTKKSSLSDVLSEVMDTDYKFNEKIDWDLLLDVGPTALFPAGKVTYSNPDEDQKVRNVEIETKF
jgi:hypothetical protein